MSFVSKLNELFGFVKTKDAEGAEVWLVSWTSWYGSTRFPDHTVNYKAFLFKEDAELFAKSLKDAHELLQNSTELGITIKKQE
jgi:hypothetical protein